MMSIDLRIGPVWVGRSSRRIPYSLNKRLHWASRHRWITAWKDSVHWAVMEKWRQFGSLPYQYAKVAITLCTIHLLDVDNAYTCVKPILDGLKIQVEHVPGIVEGSVRR